MSITRNVTRGVTRSVTWSLDDPGGWGSAIPVEANNGNVVQAWKGAVEPQFYGGSGGNVIKLWKGAVEPGHNMANKKLTAPADASATTIDVSGSFDMILIEN